MPVRLRFRCGYCDRTPDPLTQLCLEGQARQILWGQYLDMSPERWLVWHGRGFYGPTRYACPEHRADLVAEVRRQYGSLGPHPWRMGPFPSSLHSDDTERAWPPSQFTMPSLGAVNPRRPGRPDGKPLPPESTTRYRHSGHEERDMDDVRPVLGRIPDGVWESEPHFSTVTFSVEQLTNTFSAGFRGIEAILDGNQRTLTGTVEVIDIRVDDADIRFWLLGPEFFDADRFPQITFEASHLRPATGQAIYAPGTLTMHGITLPIEAQGRINSPPPDENREWDTVVIELATTIDRRDYGLGPVDEMSAGALTLANEIKIEAMLEFSRM